MKDLDTRRYHVSVFDEKIEDDYQYIQSFWKKIPSYGDLRFSIVLFFFQMFNDLDMKKKTLKNRIEMTKNTEKLLTDDSILILKFFMDIDEKTQKKNIKKLKEDRFKKFMVTKT